MQGFSNRLLPITLCEYDVDCDPVADLRDDVERAAHGVELAELGCGWLAHQLAGEDAPSWLAADRLKADGYCGMLAPSFFPGATTAHVNLILWRWGPDLPNCVTVHDPTGRLPKDRLSWEA
jgi:RES domain-containing protein